jgi:hypothetical protein
MINVGLHLQLVLLGTKDATDVGNKFLKQIHELKEKTKDMTPTKFAALTKDPCANRNYFLLIFTAH